MPPPRAIARVRGRSCPELRARVQSRLELRSSRRVPLHQPHPVHQPQDFLAHAAMNAEVAVAEADNSVVLNRMIAVAVAAAKASAARSIRKQ